MTSFFSGILDKPVELNLQNFRIVFQEEKSKELTTNMYGDTMETFKMVLTVFTNTDLSCSDYKLSFEGDLEQGAIFIKDLSEPFLCLLFQATEYFNDIYGRTDSFATHKVTRHFLVELKTGHCWLIKGESIRPCYQRGMKPLVTNLAQRLVLRKNTAKLTKEVHPIIAQFFELYKPQNKLLSRKSFFDLIKRINSHQASYLSSEHLDVKPRDEIQIKTSRMIFYKEEKIFH